MTLCRMPAKLHLLVSVSLLSTMFLSRDAPRSVGPLPGIYPSICLLHDLRASARWYVRAVLMTSRLNDRWMDSLPHGGGYCDQLVLTCLTRCTVTHRVRCEPVCVVVFVGMLVANLVGR